MKENNYFFVQIFLVCVKKDAEEKWKNEECVSCTTILVSCSSSGNDTSIHSIRQKHILGIIQFSTIIVIDINTQVQKRLNPTLILGRKKLIHKLIFWEWSSFPSPLQRTGVIMIYEAAALLHSRLCSICKLWRKCRVLWRGSNSILRVEKERGLTPKRRCLWNPVLATSHKQSSKLSYFANAFASKDFILEQFLSF